MHDLEDSSLRALFPDETEIPESARIAVRDDATWLVDGEIRQFAGASRPVISRISTRRGETLERAVLGREPLLGSAEASLAVEAAERAFQGGDGEWPSSPVEVRMKAALAFATAVEDRTDAIARMLQWEIGKPAKAARAEVTRSVEYIRETVKAQGELRAADLVVQQGTAGGAPHFARTHRRPLGVVLCVAPFNYPINEFLTTVVPALLMGNVVLAKTPRHGALANAELF